jgi:hypothetical protein
VERIPPRPLLSKRSLADHEPALPFIIRAPDLSTLDAEAMFRLRNLFPTPMPLSGNRTF